MPSRARICYASPASTMESERIIQVFFFGFLALMAYELYALLAPFLMPIAWAILLAFMVHPLQARTAQS